MHFKPIRPLVLCQLILCQLILALLLWCSPSLAEPPHARTNTTTHLDFIVMGDMGSGAPAQKQVAAQLIQQFENNPYPLVLLLGDLIYPDGNVKKYGSSRFTQIYKPLLQHNVEFKAALGNHDILGGYQNEVKTFFHLPSDYYTFQRGPAEFFVLDTNVFDPKQKQWLKAVLSQSKAPWKIVYGHHPVFSSGEHGPTLSLQRDLKPLLEQYHVDFYLCGHEHDYERFKTINGVHYFVSGGGGAYVREFSKKIDPNSLQRASIHHFIRFSLNGPQAHFQTIDATGQIIDQGLLIKGIKPKSASTTP